MTKKTSTPNWGSQVVRALKKLGGKAPLSAIYAEVERLRKADGLPFSGRWKHTVRRVLQEHPRTVSDGGYRSGIWKLIDDSSPKT